MKEKTHKRAKLELDVDHMLLNDLRMLAKREGCQLQAVVEEAIEQLLRNRRQGGPRHHVMAAHEESLARFGSLFERLAK